MGSSSNVLAGHIFFSTTSVQWHCGTAVVGGNACQCTGETTTWPLKNLTVEMFSMVMVINPYQNVWG